MILFLMRGVSCSGKSTLAKEIFGNLVLSSDKFRLMLTGNSECQHLNKLVFDTLRQVLEVRCSERAVTCVDATNLKFSDSKEYFEIAAKWGFSVVVLNMVPPSLEVLLQRNDIRSRETEFNVPAEAIEKQLNRYHATTEHYRETVLNLPKTYWIDVCEEDAENIQMKIINECKQIAPVRHLKIDDTEAVEVYAIGDVHGCFEELIALVEKCRLDADLVNRAAKFVMLGDYIDRGPYSEHVLNWVTTHHDVICVLLGNHEWLYVQEVNGKECRSKSRAVTHKEFEGIKDEVLKAITSMPGVLMLQYSGNNYMLSHAPIKTAHSIAPFYTNFRDHSMTRHRPDHKVLSVVLENQIPVIHVHGHQSWVYESIHEEIKEQAHLPHKQLNIDSGCVYGGMLTALRLRDLTPLQVQSKINVEHDFV